MPGLSDTTTTTTTTADGAAEGKSASGEGGKAGTTRAELPSIREALAKHLHDEDGDPPGSEGKAGEGGGSAGDGKAAAKGGKAEPKSEGKAATKADDGAGKAGTGGGKAAAGEAKGEGGKAEPPKADQPGYAAYLKREAKRVEAAEARVTERVQQLGAKERDLGAREQQLGEREKKAKALEEREKLWESDPIKALAAHGWDGQKVIAAFVQAERDGKVTVRPHAAAGEGEKGEKSAEAKRLEQLEEKEREREHHGYVSEFMSGVSAEAFPHLDAYFAIESKTTADRLRDMAHCFKLFEADNGRPPRSDAELRPFMERIAKRLLTSAESRATYDKLKKIFEPAARAAEDDAGDAGGDGASGEPAPKGRDAEGSNASGRQPGKSTPLDNRASTNGGAPANQYIGKGAVAKMLARHRAADD